MSKWIYLKNISMWVEKKANAAIIKKNKTGQNNNTCYFMDIDWWNKNIKMWLRRRDLLSERVVFYCWKEGHGTRKGKKRASTLSFFFFQRDGKWQYYGKLVIWVKSGWWVRERVLLFFFYHITWYFKKKRTWKEQKGS